MDSGGDRGNLVILDKVDRLRELIGNRISIPQVVVVGDQSSGKSSVLEGITGFAFPRDAGLCTRYATQITCRREGRKSVTISVIPHAEADAAEKARLKQFSCSLEEMTGNDLAHVFTQANEIMGIRMGKDLTLPHTPGRAFSEHILKVEICGPQEEHFTVIDVPGIFREVTEGLTTETDIDLVRSMVKSYIKDERTIILAIMPANVDPATQEILRLSREVDPGMTRTMGVLTKPDLAIEKAIQNVAIDYPTGKRGNLTLGFYIVKNRGPDQVDMTLQQGQEAEQAFFSQEPWAVLKLIGRAGIPALKLQVRKLLMELIKQEFPKLRAEVMVRLSDLKVQRDALGVDRSSPHAQRAYLGRICHRFQAITQDALIANYTAHPIFDKQNALRLITRIMELNEEFSDAVWNKGHTRPFVKADSAAATSDNVSVAPSAVDPLMGSGQELVLPEVVYSPEWAPEQKKNKSRAGKVFDMETNQEPVPEPIPEPVPDIEPTETTPSHIISATASGAPSLKTSRFTVSDNQGDFTTLANFRPKTQDYPELGHVSDISFEKHTIRAGDGDIMEYIEEVYKNSRGVDLGTFNGSLLATIFKEQTRNWDLLAMGYIGNAILLVHHFIVETLKEVCVDKGTRDELWINHLVDPLLASYSHAVKQTKFLLDIERNGSPLTLNHYFNDSLQKCQTQRLIAAIKNFCGVDGHSNSSSSSDDRTGDKGAYVTWAQVSALSADRANAAHVREYVHDVLKSYYKVARKRFVDGVCQQAVFHFLLTAEGGPLQVFDMALVHALDNNQLDDIAGEKEAVRAARRRLEREVSCFEEALGVLKGSSGRA